MKIKVETLNQRIDKYLSENTDYSRSLIQKMLEAEYILVNEKPVKANYLLRPNDEILLKDGFIIETDLKPEAIELAIVYEDDDLMVINKPSGLVVHPGNGNTSGTLANALINHTQNLSSNNGEIRPGIVHRIDKDTSGLMLVAKNDKTHELLAEGFKNKTIKREYLALLIGELKTDTATVDAPIGRDPKERKRMAVTEQNAKKAVTHLTTIQRYKGYTLVKLNLETGRTHQIRVHMKYIGFPVFNDPVYAKSEIANFGQFLHSSSLSFMHPQTGEQLNFTCDLPSQFKDFLNDLDAFQ